MYYVQSVAKGQREIEGCIQSKEGAVHLLPLELNQRWVVNNVLDYDVWNKMNDRDLRHK